MTQKQAGSGGRPRRRRVAPGGSPRLSLVTPPDSAGAIPEELDGPGSVPDLVREGCADPHPVSLLTRVSSVMSATDPRLADPTHRREGPTHTLAELVETYLAVGAWETDVLCRVVGQLTRDAGLARRIRRGLGGRGESGPDWLCRLDDVAVTDAYLSTDPLRDADTILLEVSLPGDRTASLVALVDHNLGGAVRDCFTIPAPAAYYIDAVESSRQGHHLTVERVRPADAHAMLTPAAARSLRLWPRPETDTWPGTLPLLEHLVGQLPAGGRGYPRPASAEEQAVLVDELLASDHWRWQEDGPQADTADLLVWLHNDALSLGPARVSPGTVQLVMEDLWEGRSTHLSRQARRALPEVLQAYARFVHRRQRVPAELTQETLRAIDSLAPALRRRLEAQADRPTVADLIAERLRVEAERVELVQDLLVQQLGSREAVARLDDAPLPDEELDWSAVPADQVPRLARLLETAEPVALEIAGVELRTVLRRLVTRVATTAPGLLVTGKREERLAAALLWVAASMNGLLGPGAGTTVAEMLASFGLTGTVADRGRAILRALGWEDISDAQYRLIHPELLVSQRRRDLVELRDHYLGEG